MGVLITALATRRASMEGATVAKRGAAAASLRRGSPADTSPLHSGEAIGHRHPHAADRTARRAVPAADGAAGPAQLVRAHRPGLVAGDPRRGLALPRLDPGAVLDHGVDGPDGAGDRLRLRQPLRDR